MADATSDSRVLGVLGYCSLAFYCTLATFFWTSWSSSTTGADEAIVFIAGITLAGLYFYGLTCARRARTAVIVIFAIAFGLVGFLILPFDSTDVFFYMATGWQQAHYHNNPYSGLLRDVEGMANDPIIDAESMARNKNPWQDLPLPYGFLFALVSRVIAWLGRGSFWATLAWFNALNLAMHAGIALLLWKSAKFIPLGNPKVVLYLYSWNPFVVLQYLANVHNDILVAFLVVLAAYCLLSGRSLWTLPILAASALVKYVTAALIPFAFIFLLRNRGWPAAIRSVLLATAVTILSALPYLREVTGFRYKLILAQLSESTGSLHAFILYSYRMLTGLWPFLLGSMPEFRLATQVVLWLIFGIFAVRELHASWSERSIEPLLMIQRWTSILFAIIFVASSQFFAWYIGMLFPLALLTDRKSTLADTVILLSGTHMLSFTFLRRKAIGYFVLATLVPIIYMAVVSSRRKATARALPSAVTTFSHFIH